MGLSRTFARIMLWALVGGVTGLLVGLLLESFRLVDDPFWSVAAGIVAGAVASQLVGPARRSG